VSCLVLSGVLCCDMFGFVIASMRCGLYMMRLHVVMCLICSMRCFVCDVLCIGVVGVVVRALCCVVC
jgi:hypothetical protein